MTRAALPLIAALLAAGCTVARVLVNVPPDIPPRPILPVCLEAPHPIGTVVTVAGRGGAPAIAVQLPYEDATAIRVYLADAPRCRETWRILLDAHIEKLENRLRALGAD